MNNLVEKRKPEFYLKNECKIKNPTNLISGEKIYKYKNVTLENQKKETLIQTITPEKAGFKNTLICIEPNENHERWAKTKQH